MNDVASCPEHLDILSLCTGGGGLDLGVELAIPGARTVCMVEREAFAVAHLVSAMEQGRLHQAPVWSDATTFDGRRWRGCVDGLIGGIPCQPYSLAGKREGSDDERDLWSPARRIIVQSGAWFVLIENVSGMLSAKPGLYPGALRVRRDLQRLGFDVEGGLFTAAEVGASHERERVFILAVADARRPRSQGREWTGASRKRNGAAAPRSVAKLRRAPLDRAIGQRRRAWRDDYGGDAGHEPYAASELALAYSDSDEPSAIPKNDGEMRGVSEAQCQPEHRSALSGGSRDHVGLFPPGPSDIAAWRRVLARSPDLEPSVRRMVDGMAARVDLSGPHAARVERLRLLGNGVHPLEAAYAIRTLATRLAASGSTGAARLVRMMEGA